MTNSLLDSMLRGLEGVTYYLAAFSDESCESEIPCARPVFELKNGRADRDMLFEAMPEGPVRGLGICLTQDAPPVKCVSVESRVLRRGDTLKVHAGTVGFELEERQ